MYYKRKYSTDKKYSTDRDDVSFVFVSKIWQKKKQAEILDGSLITKSCLVFANLLSRS